MGITLFSFGIHQSHCLIFTAFSPVHVIFTLHLGLGTPLRFTRLQIFPLLPHQHQAPARIPRSSLRVLMLPAGISLYIMLVHCCGFWRVFARLLFHVADNHWWSSWSACAIPKYLKNVRSNSILLTTRSLQKLLSDLLKVGACNFVPGSAAILSCGWPILKRVSV